MGQNDTLTQKQKRALRALLVSPSFTQAAQVAGIGRQTLYRYLSDPVFLAALTQANTTAMRLVVARMIALLQKSLDVIEQALDGGDDKTALQAASVVIRHCVALLEFTDLEQRVAELEKTIGGVR